MSAIGRRVCVVTPRVDPRRLRTLLDRSAAGRELPIVTAAREDGLADDLVIASATVARSDGRTLGVPEPDGRDWDHWAAGRILRLERAVPDAGACASPGIGALLRGEYRCPDAPWPRTGVEGVVLVKPGMNLTPELFVDLAERLAECGYRVRRARVVEGSEVTSRDLARRHYGVHVDIARRGRVEAHERIDLLRLYDRPEFEASYGMAARDVEVLPVEVFMRDRGVPEEVIMQWSEEKTSAHGLASGSFEGPNEIGDHKWVTLFKHDAYNGGRPALLLNPHMATVLARFHDGSPCVALHVQAASPLAISWRRLRSECCGVTDPELAAPGSIRGDARAGWCPLRGLSGSRVSRSFNGLHMSSGVVEAVSEIATWFEEAAGASANVLASAGISPSRVRSRFYVDYLGERRVLAELARGADVEELGRHLSVGKLATGDTADTPEGLLALVDASVSVARTLAVRPNVVAVLGLPVRARPWRRPETDIVVVTKGDERGPERFERDGLSLSVRTIPEREALAIVKAEGASGHAALLCAATFAHRHALSDPDDRRAKWIRAAMRLSPSRAFLRSLVARAAASLRRSSVREAFDALAELELSRHPLRFDAHRWVVTDLAYIGRTTLLDAVLRAHGLSADLSPSEAERIVILADRISHVAPSRSVEHPSDAIATARSLLEEGCLVDAAYVAQRGALGALLALPEATQATQATRMALASELPALSMTAQMRAEASARCRDQQEALTRAFEADHHEVESC